MSKLKSVSKKDEDLHELVEITEGLSPCKICLLPANPEDVKVGPLYKLGIAKPTYVAFGSQAPWNRKARTRKCKKSYHYPCGQKAGAMFQFYGEFNSFCETHRPVQAPSVHKGQEVEEEDQCGVCLDEMEERVSPATLWTPCCGGWFHRSCVLKMAESSGLSFFKCPLCNNKETFEKEMLEHGVYIPNQDAEWEKDNAYEDLYQRHNSCDVEVCVCPDGRFRDDENNDDSPWEIFLCRTCGHQGSHITCGNLDFEFPMFECQSCLDIVRKQPTLPRPVFHPNVAGDDIQIEEESDDGQSSSSQKFELKVKKGKKLQKAYVNISTRMTNVNENLLDLSVILDGNIELENGGNVLVAEKRRESLRQKPVLSYREKFKCDYKCGFSTKVLATMTKHIKRHHGATTTMKIFPSATFV